MPRPQPPATQQYLTYLPYNSRMITHRRFRLFLLPIQHENAGNSQDKEDTQRRADSFSSGKEAIICTSQRHTVGKVQADWRQCTCNTFAGQIDFHPVQQGVLHDLHESNVEVAIGNMNRVCATHGCV